MYSWFLVSSVVHKEKNALSEAAWILSKYSSIENFEPILLSVGGLGLLKLTKGTIQLEPDIFDRLNQLHLKEGGIKFCHKIVPLELYTQFSEEALLNWTNTSVSPRIKEHDRWRITINKRHTHVKERPLISKIASCIRKGVVDLKDPILIIQIEIIANYVGLSLLKPFEVLPVKHYLKLD